MENVIAPVNTPPIISNQTVTPVVPVVPAAEDPTTELARLRQEKIDADKRLADKDKHINDLSTEKATLESRLSGYQAVESVVPAQAYNEGNQTQAQPNVSNVSGYVRPEDIPEIIERTGFINKMKDDNKDMIEFGLEPIISLRADQLIRSGKSFKEAVATAVKEQREKFDKIKTPVSPVSPEVPSSVRGESGSNPPVEAPVKAEESLGDEGDERKRLRAKRGL